MQKEGLIQFLEKLAPKNLAEDWDNVGPWKERGRSKKSLSLS